jgi:hypothetical protein
MQIDFPSMNRKCCSIKDDSISMTPNCLAINHDDFFEDLRIKLAHAPN